MRPSGWVGLWGLTQEASHTERFSVTKNQLILNVKVVGRAMALSGQRDVVLVQPGVSGLCCWVPNMPLGSGNIASYGTLSKR